MSELTPCNFCSLRRIRKHWKGKAKIVLRDATDFKSLGGTNVFAVPPGEKLDESTDKNGNHGKQFVAWMMDISNECVC